MPSIAGDTDSRPAKKARIPLACTSCRERKVRCDGGIPLCQPCSRRDPQPQNDCVYQSLVQARRSTEVSNLLSRISELEHELSHAKSQPPGPDITPRHVASPSGDAARNINGSAASQRFDSGLTETGQDVGPHQGHAAQCLDEPTSGNGVHQPTPFLTARGFSHDLSNIIVSHGEGSSAYDGSQGPGGYPSSMQTFVPQRSSVDSNPYGTGGNTQEETGESTMTHQGGRPPLRTRRESETLASSGLILLSEHEPSAIAESSIRQQADPADDGETNLSGLKSSRVGDEPYFYGESSSMSFMREVYETVSHTDNSPENAESAKLNSVHDESARPRQAHDRDRKFPFYFLGDRCLLKDFDLPPRALADHFLDCYLNRVYILYPFVHKPTLLAAYEDLWNPSRTSSKLTNSSEAGLGNLADGGSNSRVFYCGLNAIFALSCPYSDLPIHKVAGSSKLYLDRAMVLLHNDLLDRPTISLVQVLLLIGLHLQSTSHSDRCWNIIGMACRMAQGLGFQVDVDKGGKGLVSLPSELRRRVWYSCVILDMTISITLGRTSMTSDGFSVPLPNAINDEDLTLVSQELQPQGITQVSFLVEAIKVTELVGKLLRQLYKSKPAIRMDTAGNEDFTLSFNIVVDLETAWSKLVAELPAELSWERFTEATEGLNGLESACLERQRNVLHQRLLQLKLLLYRPSFLQLCRKWIPQSRQPQVPQQIAPESDVSTIGSFFAIRCSMSCFRTAKELLDTVDKCHRNKSAGAWWYGLFYAYNAGIIAILTRSCEPLTDALGIKDVESSWQKCQDILQEMTTYGNHADRCLRSLKELRLKISALENRSQPALDKTGRSSAGGYLNHNQSYGNTNHASYRNLDGNESLGIRETPASGDIQSIEESFPIDQSMFGVGMDGVNNSDFRMDIPTPELWDMEFESWWNSNVFFVEPGPLTFDHAT